jgi:hypothetical protein
VIELPLQYPLPRLRAVAKTGQIIEIHLDEQLHAPAAHRWPRSFASAHIACQP